MELLFCYKREIVNWLCVLSSTSNTFKPPTTHPNHIQYHERIDKKLSWILSEYPCFRKCGFIITVCCSQTFSSLSLQSHGTERKQHGEEKKTTFRFLYNSGAWSTIIIKFIFRSIEIFSCIFCCSHCFTFIMRTVRFTLFSSLLFYV